MDNPQHYQPLSHALHPPPTALNRSNSNQYSPPPHVQPHQSNLAQEEEEEEDPEDDDDDEGLVEEQLNHNDPDAHGSDPSSPKPSALQDGNTSPSTEQKRRPGRPRGSKNRRPRVGSGKHDIQLSIHGPTPSQPSAGPPHHPSINPQNKEYYDFQWRILNLCSEFYRTAEEVVKETSPLVVAQCYNMGPGPKIDPLNMLNDARQFCDSLLANPAQLFAQPPPPIFPAFTSSSTTQLPPVAPSTPPVSTITPAASSSNIITNPQSFVVPLGTQPGYSQYAVFQPPPAQYPTTPYYQLPSYPTSNYFVPSQPAQNTQAPSSVPSATSNQPSATITTTPATGGTVIGNQGVWSEDEMERLKKLAEESRATSSSGQIEWEKITEGWGISRSRHQILIKATQMGLKESSTRAVKRRRENGPGDNAPVVTSIQASTSTASAAANIATASPSHSASQSGSTPAASPALQNQPRPPSAKGGTKMSWAMPAVAVNAPSPVSNPMDQQQRSTYYRPRPSQGDSSGTIPQQHQFIYNSNGQGSNKNGK